MGLIFDARSVRRTPTVRLVTIARTPGYRLSQTGVNPRNAPDGVAGTPCASPIDVGCGGGAKDADLYQKKITRPYFCLYNVSSK